VRAKQIVGKKKMPDALKALRRAAKKALEFARLTGTPCYVMENGRIVDIAKRPLDGNRTERKNRTGKS
jgi:hypothetical protein